MAISSFRRTDCGLYDLGRVTVSPNLFLEPQVYECLVLEVVHRQCLPHQARSAICLHAWDPRALPRSKSYALASNAETQNALRSSHTKNKKINPGYEFEGLWNPETIDTSHEHLKQR